ncbi:MAG TPA: bifunctional diguanylate cyclase/phosphodiesterase [Pseudolabrys sp.]|nr:bifunctional diguanylate cyclase/phosphodiesterase [Pseudolabrys sp.]
MHETNAEPAGSRPRGWLPAWTKRPDTSSLAFARPTPAKWILSASRLIGALSVVALAGMFVIVVIGFGLARHNDERLSLGQHATLRSAIAEFRPALDRSAAIDLRLLRMAEQIPGLKNLKFESGPARDRESLPVMDSAGRITGFFTWDKSRPMTQVMRQLAAFFAAVAVIVFGFAALSLWQLKRAQRELAMREAEVARAADEDKLTGLPNYAKTLELLDLSLAERADDECTTFALIELDGMDDIAATHGVLGSDELIVAVARRIRETLPAGVFCGRIAGDKFAVAMTAAHDANSEVVLRAAIDAIARPHRVDTVVRVSAHAGFAQAPRHAATRGELTRRADLALRAAAKRGPGAIVAFDVAIDTVSTDQKFIHRELPRAVSANDLDLHYQPIVLSQGGRMVGVEALLRWNHARRGSIPPATFIPVAEQMGLMGTIGAFVLRRALHEARRWPEDLYIAVNLSPLQVRDGSIVELVRSALAESGVSPSRLVLEITEGVLIDNPDEMVKRIKDLHELGVRVALDDFGSGYSNLGYLQRFPLDKIKIDRSFVAALGHSSNGGVIIQAMVALGRALGLSVLVEGVETEHQRVLLRLAGCDEMQGFLFARPAPARAIDALLEKVRQDGMPGPASGEALTA